MTLCSRICSVLALFIYLIVVGSCSDQAVPSPTPTAIVQSTVTVLPVATSTATSRPATVTATPVPNTPTARRSTSTPIPASPTHPQELHDKRLVEALRRGGYVIYFRHATSDPEESDVDRTNLANCETQRNLTSEGIAEARAIGEAFRLLDIPHDEIVASEYCRAWKTALTAFGRADINPDVTSIAGLADVERDQRIRALRTLLATPPATGTNRIIVSHYLNLYESAEIPLREGEAAIFVPQGDSFTLVARVIPRTWTDLAEIYGTPSEE